jgi:SRSO17 transposase
MKETTPAAMPPCFDRWCQRFDDIFGHIAQKREFRNYLGGLLGESERKNLKQMATNALASDLPQITPFFNRSTLVIQRTEPTPLGGNESVSPN